ncbi:MAG: putative toxin-antitoxin system toxin component, PIN family [Alphaproteobacteria bacterium]
MERLAAFLDASVLYPAPLRDLLMRLALRGLFRAIWSARVHEEWIANVLAKRPDLTRAQLERTRELMDAHATDSIVTGYEELIDGLDLPDANDRHVLAAAIHGGADLIVTFNLKDFPAHRLESFEIEAQHPDTFVTHLIELHAGAVVATLREHRAALKNPPRTAAEYLQTLERQGLAETVSLLRAFEEVI